MLKSSFQIQVRGMEMMQNDDQNCSEGTFFLQGLEVLRFPSLEKSWEPGRKQPAEEESAYASF